MDKKTLDTYHEELGTTLGEALIAPTKIYVKALRSIKDAGVRIKACSHITGGGFYENIPRMLKEGTHAVVEKDSYPIPPIFAKLAKEGNYDYFTTTLSISPLKNAEKINEIGEALAEIYEVKHLPSDFKKKNGYKRSIELSHEYGLYRQNYCGCVFSKREQEEKMKQKQISEGSAL